jgi:hypothetical protein
MTHTRTFAVAAMVGVALVITGCGAENVGDSPGSGSGTTIDPQTPTIASGPDPSSGTLGTVILNQRLDVSPAEYPLIDVPTQVEVGSVTELGEAYKLAPGIDEIVAGLEDTQLDAGERLFAYLVNACTTEQVKLELRGNEVPMIVSGTSTLRCEPPTTLVVWVVGDEVPADATPAQAIQK